MTVTKLAAMSGTATTIRKNRPKGTEMKHRIYHYHITARRPMRHDECVDVSVLPGATWAHQLRTYRWLRRSGTGKAVAREVFWRFLNPTRLVTVEPVRKPVMA